MDENVLTDSLEKFIEVLQLTIDKFMSIIRMLLNLGKIISSIIHISSKRHY